MHVSFSFDPFQGTSLMTVSFLVVLVSEDAPPTCVLVHQKAAHQEHQAGAVEAAAAAAAVAAAAAADPWNPWSR